MGILPSFQITDSPNGVKRGTVGHRTLKRSVTTVFPRGAGSNLGGPVLLTATKILTNCAEVLVREELILFENL
jgi:hypothetical protein